MIVEIHEGARNDAAAEAEWYERHQPGLGYQFLAAVEEGVDRIRIANDLPLYEPVRDRRIRRLLLHRFPHVLICQQLDERRVLLLAVANASRDTTFWKRRRK